MLRSLEVFSGTGRKFIILAVFICLLQYKMGEYGSIYCFRIEYNEYNEANQNQYITMLCYVHLFGQSMNSNSVNSVIQAKLYSLQKLLLLFEIKEVKFCTSIAKHNFY